jgi:hypothetical protein
LHAVIGTSSAPQVNRQYPAPGINWIGDGLGYFYHSHGPNESRGAEHGHFHLFSQVPERHAGACSASYAHLIGIDVDATGRPLRMFTTNLWVTNGQWRSARFVRAELSRFAALASRPDVGPEKWISLVLQLFPQQVLDVIRLRERRVAQWRRDEVKRRLSDRRIRILSSMALSMGSKEGS